MKKFAKMSLVAAIAVAGVTSANAGSLEDAVKNTEISGSAVYRYDDRSLELNNGQSVSGAVGNDTTNNSYKVVVALKSKVNDDVAFKAVAIAASGIDGSMVGNETTTQAAPIANISLEKANFIYTGIANTTIIAGKQGLGTPFTVAADSTDNDQIGDGILAITTLGPVTLAGGYFNSTNLNQSGNVLIGNGSENVALIAAMGSIGPVALDAWYLDREDLYDVYTIGAKANFDLGGATLSAMARHTELDLDTAPLAIQMDNSLTQLKLGVKAGIFGGSIAYGWTDSEGGIAAEDNDATTGFQGWGLNLNGVADADLLKLNVNAQVTDTVNIALNYNILDRNDNIALGRITDIKDKEYYTQVTYNMSKNFSTYLRLGQVNYDNVGLTAVDKGTRGRIQIAYTF